MRAAWLKTVVERAGQSIQDSWPIGDQAELARNVL